MPDHWPTINEQIMEIDREIALRYRVYPRFVANGKLKPEKAEWQIRCLKAARASLLELKGQRENAQLAAL